MTKTPIRLLLLEDSSDDARLVQAALAQQAPGEFALTTAERLADALTRIQAERFDAVLCDLGLPDSAGLATAQAIAAQAPALPLVVLTGSHDESVGREAILHGAQDYLVKGEAGAGLIARTLRYAIERKRLENALRTANESLELRVAGRTADLEAAIEKLRESDDRYRDLVENSQELICTHDLEGKLLSVNAAAVRLTGYAREALLRMNLADLLARGTRDGFAAYLDEIRTKGAARGLMRVRTAGGETRWWEYNNTLRTQGVAVPVVRGMAQDITERKQAETELLRLRHAMDTSNDSIYLTDVETLRFVFVNHAACENLGYAREQLLELGPLKVLDLDPAQLRHTYDQVIAAGERGSASESRYTRKDGSSGWSELSRRALRSEGRWLIVTIARDITQRKRTEDALRAAEEQFRGLVEQSIAGTYVIQDGKLAYVNPRFAEIFGYASADELIGREPLSLVIEKDRGAVLDVRRRIEDGLGSVSYGYTALRKDGATIEVGVHSAHATYRGRPAIISLMQDISEKKRAEAQIQRHVTQLENAFMSTVEVAMTLSEMRDPYRAGHERRVSQIAAAIGAEIGFDARRIEGLRVAGFLHDIGAIAIPAEILAKPGKVSAIELRLIQGHSQAGYDILKGVEFPWPVAQIVLQHHERIDGSGYPQGLRGEAILLEARILAVADVIEAMSAHRPYRASLGIEAALAEIERGRGSAYDPAVAAACLKLFRERSYAIPA